MKLETTVQSATLPTAIIQTPAVNLLMNLQIKRPWPAATLFLVIHTNTHTMFLAAFILCHDAMKQHFILQRLKYYCNLEC